MSGPGRAVGTDWSVESTERCCFELKAMKLKMWRCWRCGAPLVTA